MLNDLTQLNRGLLPETDTPHFEWLNPTIHLADLVQAMQMQPQASQQFLHAQAASLASALQAHALRVSFELPAEIVLFAEAMPVALPSWIRRQHTQAISIPFSPPNPLQAFANRLGQLTLSDLPELKTTAQLLAFETAQAIVEQQAADLEHVELPFSEAGRLGVASIDEAEGWLKEKKFRLDLLDTAAQFCPAITEVDRYRQSSARLMRLIETQGKWLSAYLLHELVADFRRMLAEHALNRGLGFSLPYFDDRTLEVRYHNFTAIPAGRVMYTPAFVILAIQKEASRLFHNQQLSPSTRDSLLETLSAIQNVVKENSKSNPSFLNESR
jgi:hypothetical protein